MPSLYDDMMEAIEILREARHYVQETHDNARAAHDNYGDRYMDPALWKIILDTEALLTRIDTAIAHAEPGT